MDPNRVVPTDQLIDHVWGDDPPASARNLLSGYVTRLRQAFDRAAGDSSTAVRLVRRSGGYAVEAEPDGLDLWRFRRLITQSGTATDLAASHLLGQALRLWRGRPFADTDSRFLRTVRETLDGERLAAVARRNDVELRLGRHRDLVSDLDGLVGANPLHEAFIGQLLIALHRSGRSAEALLRYARAAERIREELGVCPGPHLRQIHTDILRDEPPVAASPMLVPTEQARATFADGRLKLTVDSSGAQIPEPHIVIVIMLSNAGSDTGPR